MFLELAGAVLGNLAGAKFGQMAGKWLGGDQGGIGSQIDQLVNTQNQTLNDYMNKALQSSAYYTGLGKDTLMDARDKGQANLVDYLNKATQQAKAQSQYGQQGARAALSPMLSAGMGGLDSYMDSLGLSRPITGYGALQLANMQQAQQDQARNEYLLEHGSLPTNPGQFTQQAPELQSFISGVTDSQLKQQLYNSMSLNPDAPGWSYLPGRSNGSLGAKKLDSGLLNSGGITGPIQWDANAPPRAPIEHLYDARDRFVNQIFNADQSSTDWVNARNAARTSAGTQYYTGAKNQYDTALANYNANLGTYNQYQGLMNQNAPSAIQQAILNAQSQGLFNK